MRNFWEKKERVRERCERDKRGGRDERETREEGEMRESSPLLFFSHRPRHAGEQRAVFECGQVPDSSFRCPGSALERGGAHLSMGECT